MKALTLKQPWAWAVAHAGKDVENRTWKPPQAVIGHQGLWTVPADIEAEIERQINSKYQNS